MSVLLCATPYNINAPFWYFESIEEYQEKYEAMLEEWKEKYGEYIEEYEIQFIDGDEDECVFARACEPDQATLVDWFDNLEKFKSLNDYERVALAYLLDDRRMNFEEALSKYDEVCIFEGSVLDYAYEFMTGCYDLEKMMGNLSSYFDYEAFARDLRLGGDVDNFEYDGMDYVITNAGCF